MANPGPVPTRDAACWVRLVLACLFRKERNHNEGVNTKAVALRLAASSDDTCKGNLPSAALLAAELEMSIISAAVALTNLAVAGFIVTDRSPAASVPGLESGQYQLTVDEELLEAMRDEKLIRGVPEIIADADRAYAEWKQLTNPGQGDSGGTRQTSLYRWFDADGVLLYVGITGSLANRQDSHGRRSSWAEFATQSTVERFPTRAAAEKGERAAIGLERPLFNHVHNDTPDARRRLVEYLIQHGRTDLLAPAVSRG